MTGTMMPIGWISTAAAATNPARKYLRWETSSKGLPNSSRKVKHVVLRLRRHAEERFQRRERHEIAEDDPFADPDPGQEDTQQGEPGE